MRLTLVILAWLWASAALAAGPVHCYLACPASAGGDGVLIVREAYSVQANGVTKMADWVAYRITRETLGPSRPRVWRHDPALPADRRLDPADYKGAYAALRVDRGHLAPLASLAGVRDWAATNYLSNIAPQKSALNRGPWARLEAAERRLVERKGFDAVHVLTGPLFESEMPALPRARKSHRVPSGFWKMIVGLKGDEVFAAAFVMAQDLERSASFCAERSSVLSLEERSGLDLPDEGLVAPPLEPLLGCAPAEPSPHLTAPDLVQSAEAVRAPAPAGQ